MQVAGKRNADDAGLADAPARPKPQQLQSHQIALHHHENDPRPLVEIIAPLRNISTPAELNLRWGGTWSTPLQHAVDSLLYHNSAPLLIRLHVYGAIGADGAPHLARLLEKCSNLTHLQLSRCSFYEGKGLHVICDALIRAKAPLEHLDLTSNLIRIAGSWVVADFIRKCPTLTSLSLMSNELGDAGFKNICTAISQRGSAFERLECCSNHITQVTPICWLLDSFVVNLRSLGLSRNDIHPTEAKTLALSLKANKSLRELRIGNNKMGVTGVTSIVEAVKQCMMESHVIELNIVNNGVNNAKAKQRLSALLPGVQFS